ncbi:MAG: DUF2057 domain-containing protein [Succinivibrionaceae bacterium]|nr:DUF2057 domain-containing protein [Succinivibrionaceae bacterium]
MLNTAKTVGAAALALAAVLGATAADAANFKVPVHFSLELVDGLTNGYDYSRFSRELELGPGRHQVVVRFGANVGSGENQRLVQASNPIVLEFSNMAASDSYTFKYRIPSSVEAATDFAREQVITLTDAQGKELPKSKAEWYILASENGFAMLRDYRQDLMSLGRLYAPTYVEGTERGIGMTAYGAPTVTATSAAGNILNQPTPHGMTMDVPTSTASQESNMSTSSTHGGKAYGATYKDLVRLYESADDKTKLQFVKYVMSH